jgi:biotin carboxylase
MARVLLLLPTSTYRAPDFLAAAARLGAEVVVGSEQPQALAGSMGPRAVVVPFGSPGRAVAAIEDLHSRLPLDAVVAVDDQGVRVAAEASARLGLRSSPPGAVASTRDKAEMRERLAAAGVRQPDYRVAQGVAGAVAAAEEVGYPCVLKPVSRSGSQGVIRADTLAQAEEAAERVFRILKGCAEPLLVERYVAGDELAVEALLANGRLQVLAVFDKPDPLEGPYFEETIYVTPSLQPAWALESAEEAVGGATAALGLSEGPVHAEVRVDADAGGPGKAARVTVLELAARSIGGLCSRALRFGSGMSLEEVVLRHALGLGPDGITREAPAAGVMMLPIRSAGILEEVSGRDQAMAVPGIVGLELSIPPGRELVPLPEGDRYLGFLFARGATPQEVEGALRSAEARLEVHVRPPHR